MPKHDDDYCGGEATRIVFRGRSARLFCCDSCEYEGSGSVKPYATDVLGQEKKAGTYYGPARKCGERLE